jgi:hypothetical protein
MANAIKDRKTVFEPLATALGPMGDFGLTANYVVPAGVAQNLDANGRPKNPGSADEIVAGVTHQPFDNTGGANDAIKVPLYRGPHKFALHGINPPTAEDNGRMAYFADNQTVSRSAADGSPGGKIESVEADGVVVNVGWMPLKWATDIGDLLDLTAGVADTTLQALPNPADAPATPDALRDDIVNNLLPVLRNNFADIAAKLNAVIASIR